MLGNDATKEQHARGWLHFFGSGGWGEVETKDQKYMKGLTIVFLICEIMNYMGFFFFRKICVFHNFLQ